MTRTQSNPNRKTISILATAIGIFLLSIVPRQSLADLNLIAETPVIVCGEMHYDAERELIYCCNGYGLLVIDFSNPWRPEIVGQFPTDEWTDKLSYNGNMVYVQPSSGDDFHPKVTAINLEDPSTPEFVDAWNSPADDKLWGLACNGDFVYVVHGTESPGSGEDVNLSTLQPMEDGELDLVSTVDVPASSYMISVENCLYLSAAFSMNLVSLEDPELPECIDVIGGMWHKLVYKDEHVYSGGPFSAVTINNVEDPTDPFIVNAVNADTSVYDITVNRDLMAVSRRTGTRFYGMWDFPDEEIILDVDDFEDPTPWLSENVLLTDNALITSFDEYGMRFFDIIDPFEVEQYEDIRQPPGAFASQVFNLGDGFVTMSGTTELISYSEYNGEEIELVGEILVPEVENIVVRGNLVFAYCDDIGIQIISFEDLENPEAIGLWEPLVDNQRYTIESFTVSEDGNTVYTSFGPGHDTNLLSYVDVSDPEDPRFGGIFFDEFEFYSLVVSGDNLIGFANNIVCTFNIEEQRDPRHLATSEISCGRNPVMQGDYIYLTSRSTRATLRALDVSDIRNPRMVYNPDTRSEVKASGLAVRGDVLLQLCGRDGIVEWDISDPTQPDSIGWFDTPGSAKAGCWLEDVLVLADYSSIRIYGHEEPPPPEPFTLHLQPGWSIVSSPVTPVDQRIIQLFEPLVENDNLQIVKDYLGHFYIPHMYNDIPPWDVTRGYWIKLNEPDSLTFEGEEVPERTPILLPSNWSTVAYLPRQSCEAPDAFINVIDQLMLVKDDDGNFYFPELGFCNIPPLQRGRGYQVKVSEATELVWTFDDMAASIQVSHPSSPSHFTEPEHTGLNMSLLIKQKDETSESLNDCEIGVFTTGGLCAGAGVLSGLGPWGLAVWGDDPTTTKTDGAVDNEQLAFRIWNGTIEDNVELAWIEGEAKYATDDLVIASLDWEAAVPQQVGLTSAYPNPFNSSARLEYSLNSNAPVNLKVIDTGGRLVTTLVNEEQSAGSHSVIWDASNQPTGVYLVTLNACGVTETVKMIHLK